MFEKFTTPLLTGFSKRELDDIIAQADQDLAAGRYYLGGEWMGVKVGSASEVEQEHISDTEDGPSTGQDLNNQN
jgi:hypothetical protein